MVLETIRREGWSRKATAQQRPRVSKLGLKGLSVCHSNETEVEAAIGQNKRATLTETLLKRESWTTAFSLTE
jgi:hypothetical protein